MCKCIVLFVPSYESGGVERNATIFANLMINRDYRVILMYCRKQSGWFDKLAPDVEKRKVGVQVVLPFINPRIIDAINMVLFGLIYLLILRIKYNCVLVSFQSNVVAIALANILRIPIAVRLSNHFSSADVDKVRLRKISELAKKYTYRFSDIVIANSVELAWDYEPILERKIDVINNPVDFKEINRKSLGSVNEKLFLQKKRPIVIAVGRLVQQKNFELLIKSFHIVLRYRLCDLVILGEGHEREKLLKLVDDLHISNFVHLLGYRKNPYKYMSKSDLFVLSSKYEGMPNSLVEAMACGLATVSTDCKTGPKEVLDFGRAGVLCQCDDVKSLAQGMLSVLLDSRLAENYKINAANHIQRYNVSIIETQYLTMLDRLFGGL